jgi:hypothetical protein
VSIGRDFILDKALLEWFSIEPHMGSKLVLSIVKALAQKAVQCGSRRCSHGSGIIL